MRNPIFDDLFFQNDETIEKPIFFKVFGLKKLKNKKLKFKKLQIFEKV